MSLDLSTIKHHPALEEIVDVLCTKTQNNDRSFFQAEVAYYFGKIASSMRATIDTKILDEIPVNVFALALAPSGYGKNHSMEIMEHQFMKRFDERFLKDTYPLITEQNLWVLANSRAARKGSDQQEEYDRVKREFESKGEFAMSFSSGSPEGVKQMREQLLIAGAGSISLQIDEIGLNLMGSTDLLTLFLELYDQGRVKVKLNKNTSENKRTEEIVGKTPTNMLLFGTPSKLLDGSQTEDQFYSFLETGYARRCVFGHGHKIRASTELTAAEIFDQLSKPSSEATVTKWATHFFTLADPSMFGWKMEVNRNVVEVYLGYQTECENLADALPEHEEIRKAEISHRHSRALKLAGAYAFIDKSTDIEMEHLTSAIKLVEESGAAFQTILSREERYVKLAKFIAQNRTAVTHADLHEKLPFYKSSKQAREDMMTLATSWGYKNHIIIKKSFIDGIEFFEGETLEKTDLEKMVVSYSSHFAYDYLEERVPFNQLHVLSQASGMHWSNHHFRMGHRTEENVIPGFNLVVLDVDEGTSLAQACDLMKDYKFLVYTTKRHQTEGHGDRFRMILPTNYTLELDNDEYKEFMQGIFAWLPFTTDESYEKREKKSETFAGGEFYYNLEGNLLDVLPFIPRTSRNEQHKQQTKDLGSLDNLERWFAQRMIANVNRNNMMIKYALCLVDAGWSLVDVRNQVHAFNKKLSDSMEEREIDTTIMVTVAKKYQNQP